MATRLQSADGGMGGVEAGSELALGETGLKAKGAKQGAEGERFEGGPGYHVGNPEM